MQLSVEKKRHRGKRWTGNGCFGWGNGQVEKNEFRSSSGMPSWLVRLSVKGKCPCVLHSTVCLGIDNDLLD